MELREMTESEQKYTYAQSRQLEAQTGCVGYLRGDFVSSGTEFYSGWFDSMKYLKTPEFKEELDAVINALRQDAQYGGLLKDRGSLSNACRQANTPKFGRDESGFRVNTQDYVYLLRLTPKRGEYNFYVYCFKRDFLDRHLRDAERGIRFITPDYKEKFRVADGDSVRIVTSGGEFRNRVVRYIDDYHMELSGRGCNLYHICEFAEAFVRNRCKDIIPLRNSLPERCYSTLIETPTIVILKRGETGFYATDIPPAKTREEAEALVDHYNGELGVSKGQQAAMQAGSMFGFACPAADPKNYDANGTPIKNHREKDAR